MKKYKTHIVLFIILVIAALALIFAEEITMLMGYPSNEIVESAPAEIAETINSL
jgi:hypothetical protein